MVTSDFESRGLLVEQAGAVRRITLNRPHKLNAMDSAMQAALFAAVDEAMVDDSVNVVVIGGAGRAFCAGADLKPTSSPADERGDTTARRPAGDLGNAPADMVVNRRRVDDWLRLWSAPKPIIAQVHGYCIGIGNELAGACDLIVCGDSAKFGMPEVRDIALPPTLGFWPERIGLALTKELLFTGRWLSADDAMACGLANRVVADDNLAETVDQLAAQIAEVPAARLSVVKQAVNSWAEASGLRASALRGAEYHAIYHQASEWAQRTAGAT